MPLTNSYGNTNRDVRRFLRENGVPSTVANVERIGREIRRSESQNRTVDRVHRELEREKGVPALRDEKGDVKARVRRQVKKSLSKRAK